MEFIIRSCNGKPIQIGARFFAGGINFIAPYAATCLRTPLPSVLRRIARSTNSHWGNSWQCHFVDSAPGDCPAARSQAAHPSLQMNLQSSLFPLRCDERNGNTSRESSRHVLSIFTGDKPGADRAILPTRACKSSCPRATLRLPIGLRARLLAVD